MATQAPDLAVVGHFSVDTLILPTLKKPYNILGGPATYTSFSAKCLGAQVNVISRVGGDFPQAYLRLLEQEGINTQNVIRYQDDSTASFELTYTKDFTDRHLKLKNKGAPLTVDDLPKDFHAKAVHLAPIDGEIEYTVAAQLKDCCDTLSVDPQGLMRSFDAEGNVSDTSIVDNQIFTLVDVYKSSQTEITYLTGESELKPAIRAIHDVGVETVIVTMGTKGSVLSVEGAFYKVPACPSEVVVDPTGAGDVFIGAFLTEYISQKESLWCAAVGSAAASFVVEGLGPAYFGKKDLVYERAQRLFENDLK